MSIQKEKIPKSFRLQKIGQINLQIDYLTNGLLIAEYLFKREGFLYKIDGTPASYRGSCIILGQIKGIIRNLEKCKYFYENDLLNP